MLRIRIRIRTNSTLSTRIFARHKFGVVAVSSPHVTSVITVLGDDLKFRNRRCRQCSFVQPSPSSPSSLPRRTFTPAGLLFATFSPDETPTRRRRKYEPQSQHEINCH
uniref:Uncharacterized protein n=1 Tax=Pseudictyota dubia TaxID=2749911 RepID=A0A7R9WE50_9STRA